MECKVFQQNCNFGGLKVFGFTQGGSSRSWQTMLKAQKESGIFTYAFLLPCTSMEEIFIIGSSLMFKLYFVCFAVK